MTQTHWVRYDICVEGKIDLSWLEWFEGFSVSATETGETILSGFVADQPALNGLLNRLFAMNLVLISINRIKSLKSP